jgi:transporter family-2 protein
MTKMLLLALAAFAGAAGACQAAANASLAGRAGIANALLVNTVVVFAGVMVLFFATGGPRTFGAVLTAPTADYIGGLGGFFVIATLAFALPRVGAAVALALMVLGQGTMALAIDHYGLWGMKVAPLNVPRVVGLVLLVGGLVLMRR